MVSSVTLYQKIWQLILLKIDLRRMYLCYILGLHFCDILISVHTKCGDITLEASLDPVVYLSDFEGTPNAQIH